MCMDAEGRDHSRQMCAFIVLNNLTDLEVGEDRVPGSLRYQTNTVTFVGPLIVGAFKGRKRRVEVLGHSSVTPRNTTLHQMHSVASSDRIATLKDTP